VDLDDPSCFDAAVAAFGLRTNRRPLDDQQFHGHVRLYLQARDLGADPQEAFLYVAKAFLMGAPFLHHLEFDPEGSTEPHALDAFELAARLSYFVWGSMPDPALFASAENQSLLAPDGLVSQAERLLQDSKASRLVSGFGGQWLEVDDLHLTASTSSGPSGLTFELGTSMQREALSYFQEFVGGRPWPEFFTADVNYVDEALGDLYGIPLSANGTRVEYTDDARFGFLGLAAPLTRTSFRERSSPTQRGVYILSRFLCSPPPPPPPMIPEIPDTEVDEPNTRALLAEHVANPACASCHALFDPFGLTLENFDNLGAYRENYSNGDPVDPSAQLPDGTTFNGLRSLAEYLSTDPRSEACLAESLFTYAHGRSPVETDEPYLEAALVNWPQACGRTLPNLVRELVVSDSFRFRRGGEL
jgi:hypothetical protein